VVEATPGADPMSHSFAVKVAFPGVDVASGSAGRASIEVGTREVVAVPKTAVLRQGGLTLVVERDGEGRAVSRVVTLGGPLGEDRVEVLSGLAGGEIVLMDLAMVPPRGARVEPPKAQS
jgi:hypothetical protein